MTPGLNLESWSNQLSKSALQISSPNQLSKFGELSNQLSKFNYYQSPKNSPDRLLTDSQQALGVWFLTDLHQIQSMKFIGWWHQVSIWRAVQISSPILVTNWQATKQKQGKFLIKGSKLLSFERQLLNCFGPIALRQTQHSMGHHVEVGNVWLVGVASLLSLVQVGNL